MAYVSTEQYNRLKAIADKKKKEEEAKKSSSSASFKTSSNTNKTTNKPASTPANKPNNASNTKKSSTKNTLQSFYSDPFYNAYQRSKQEQKQKEALKKIELYAKGDIDSTMAENMGVNTGEIDNITDKMSQRDIYLAFKPRTTTTTATTKETDDEKPLITQSFHGMKHTGAPTYIGPVGGTRTVVDESYKFDNNEDFVEYTNNQKRIKELNQEINLINNSRGYYTPAVPKEQLTDELTKLTNRNKELLIPYEKRIAEENTNKLDKASLESIAGEYARLKAGYWDEKGKKNLTDGDEYKEWQKYYFWRLNQGMNEQGFKEYSEKTITDFPKLEYVGIVTGSRLDNTVTALKLNSYYAYMTPDERHYFNYLGGSEDGSLLQNHYAEMILPALMTRKANKEAASNPFLQVLESYASGVGKSLDDAAKGVQSTFMIGNYWKDEVPQYGRIKNQVDTANAGTLQKIANMVANSTGYMTPSLAVGYLTGGASTMATAGNALKTAGQAAKWATRAKKIASMVPMYLSSSGSNYSEALADGASDEQARLRGSLKGLSEVGTQYALGGISQFGGNRLASALAKTGLGEKAVNTAKNVLNKLNNPYVKASLVNAGKIAGNAGSEMFEEYLQDYVLAPIIENMTGGDAKIDLWDENSLYTLATAAISATTLNAPSDTANIAADFQKAGEINRTASYGMDIFNKTFNQNTSQNTENLASPFDVSKNNLENNNLSQENTNSITEQNRGGLGDDVSNYSADTQDVLSKLTTAGRELLLTGKMSNAQIDSLANEINDPTSADNSKSARRERIKNALAEVKDFYEIQNNYVENLATEANAERFAKEVDSVFKGEKERTKTILVGDAPRLLKKHGADELPITINQSTMYKIAYPTGYFGAEQQGHNLGIPALKRLPQQLANPVAILKSNTQENSLVILTQWNDLNGNPVIIALHLDKNGALGLENSIASAYGKSGIEKLLIDKNGESNILYTKNNEDIQSLLSSRLQLPVASRDDTLISSISQSDPSVNTENSQNSTEQQPRRNRVEGILTPIQQAQAEANSENKDTNVRDMFINRVQARQKVKNDIANLDNQIMSGLGDFRNPNAQFMSKTDKSKENDTLAMTLKQKAAYNVTDVGAAVKEEAKAYGDNVLYQAYDNAKNYNAMVQNSIVNGQHDINGNRLGDSILDILSPYLDDMENNSDAWIDLQRYIYNKLDPERGVEGKNLLERGARYKQGELEQIEQENPEFKDVQQKIVKFFDNLLHLRVDSGIQSAESAELFRKTYPDYVPAHRNMPDDAESNVDVEDLFGMDVSSLKELAKGSELQILPLQEQLLTAATKTYRNITLNQVYNRLAKNYFENPAKSKHIQNIYKKPKTDFKNPKFSAEFLINGEKYIMEMDEFLYKGMEDLAKGMKVSSVSWLEKPTKFFKEVTTDKNISFIPKNAIRDVGSVVMFSEHPAQYVKNAGRYIGETAKAAKEGAKAAKESEKSIEFAKNFVEAAKGKYKNDAYLDLYFAVGATNSGFIDIDSDSNFLSAKKDKGVKRAVKALPNGIERVNWVVENIPRFLEFAATLDAEGNNIRQRIENGDALTAADKDVILRAAYNSAKVTTNFKVGGKMVRTLNKNGVPYLNAATQGLLQLYRNFADVKITSAKGKEGNAQVAGSLILKAVQFGAPTLLAAALRHAFKDEDWWKKETEHNKQKYIYFGENFRMLKSEAFVLIDGLGMIFQKVANGKYTDAESVKNDVTSLLLDSMPNPAMSNLLSPLMRVGLREKNNPGKTYWGGDIESAQLREIKDVTERYEEDTSLVARWLSKAIGGAFGWSPVKIEELIDSYGGGVADFLLSSTRPTFISDVKSGQLGSAFSTLSEPFTKHFVPDKLKATQITSDYYDMKEQLDKETTADKFTYNFFVENNAKDIKKLNSAYNETKNSSDSGMFVEEDRRSRMLKLKEQKDNLMQDSINNVSKYRKAAEKVLTQYPNYVYDSEKAREKSYIKMQIDYEYGGAEYALKEFDKDKYEKAQNFAKNSGIPYEDIYQYYKERQSLPKDMKDAQKDEHMENWFVKEVANKRMDVQTANALGELVLGNNYDFSSQERMIATKLGINNEEKYNTAMNTFKGMTAEEYEYYRKAYNNGGRVKSEKINALYEAGMTREAAERFYKIQSSTSNTAPATQLRNKLRLHSSTAEDIVKEYKSIVHREPEKEDEMRRAYLEKQLNYLPDEMRNYYGDEYILSTMYNILSTY